MASGAVDCKLALGDYGYEHDAAITEHGARGLHRFDVSVGLVTRLMTR